MFNSIQAGASCITALVTCLTQILSGNFVGKVEVAPEIVHIDVIESRHTVKKMNMVTFRADANLIAANGWCLQPTFRYGSKNGKYTRSGIGFGHCIPLFQRIIITPKAGFLYTRLTTKIDRPDDEFGESETEAETEFDLDFDEDRVEERYRAGSMYVGADLTLVITPCLRLSGTYQYAWSRSHTKLHDLLRAKDHTSGQLYSGLIEYNIASKFAVHAGLEYDTSLSRETYGLRTFSGKMGITYWF